MIITGAGGSGVLSDAVTDHGLSLMEIPPDLDAAFREFIPPFGAAGNPVDMAGVRRPAVRGDDPAGAGGPTSTRWCSATGTPSSPLPWCSAELTAGSVALGELSSSIIGLW
ncbi:hypothetical protein SFUMM280S_01676 [Streptomyces fumanus]